MSRQELVELLRPHVLRMRLPFPSHLWFYFVFLALVSVVDVATLVGYRTNPILLAVQGVVAVLTLAFLVYTGFVLREARELERLDGEMKALGHNQLASPRRRGDWPAFENTLIYLGELDPSRAFGFLAAGRDGRELSRSAAWPTALQVADLLATVPPAVDPFPGPLDIDSSPSCLTPGNASRLFFAAQRRPDRVRDYFGHPYGGFPGPDRP